MTKEIVYNEYKERNKYNRWVFTWNAGSMGELIPEEDLIAILESLGTTFAFQKEKGQQGRVHYQGFLVTKIRTRKYSLLNNFELACPSLTYANSTQLTLNPARGTQQQILEYVSKSETKIGNTIYSNDIRPYVSRDLELLQNRKHWYPWQNSLEDLLFLNEKQIIEPDDRHIIWITDTFGNSGKSKLVKLWCTRFPDSIIKVPFGSASQLRSSICMAGPKLIYFVDIPRTIGSEDDLLAIISVLEDIKNGFITTSMYGQFKQLLFEPPHVVVLTNNDPPRALLSKDRWLTFLIQNKNLVKTE